MPSRFWLADAGTPPLSPAFNAGWEQTGPITTTQDILCRQFVSDPMRAVVFTGTASLVIRCSESALTANVTLAAVLTLVAQDGSNPRTLFSTFTVDTEFAAAGRRI